MSWTGVHSVSTTFARLYLSPYLSPYHLIYTYQPYTPHSSSPLSCSPRPGRSPRSGSLKFFRAFMTLSTRGGSFVEKPHTRLKTITHIVVRSFLNLNWKMVCATAQVMRSSLRSVVAWTFFSVTYTASSPRCTPFGRADAASTGNWISTSSPAMKARCHRERAEIK